MVGYPSKRAGFYRSAVPFRECHKNRAPQVPIDILSSFEAAKEQGQEVFGWLRGVDLESTNDVVGGSEVATLTSTCERHPPQRHCSSKWMYLKMSELREGSRLSDSQQDESHEVVQKCVGVDKS